MNTTEFYNLLKEYAPLELAEQWDNPGFLVGTPGVEITGILVSLDATDEVLEEAVKKGFNVVLTHHPLIFHKASTVLMNSYVGKKILYAGKNNLNIISLHTNLDKVLINEVLIQKLGAFTYTELNPFTKEGYLENSMTLPDYLSLVKKSLGNQTLRYHDAGKRVYHIACTGGSGGDFLQDVIQAGCDTFITSDIPHNVWLDAQDLGINLIDADHFQTESPGMEQLCSYLCNQCPEVKISMADSNRPVICYG